jgi:hypothetical protein
VGAKRAKEDLSPGVQSKLESKPHWLLNDLSLESLGSGPDG